MIRTNELKGILEKLGIPIAYLEFKKTVAPPFLVWLCIGKDSFNADNINQNAFDNIQFELYTDRKNFRLEDKLEELLIKNDIAFEVVNEGKIDSEELYQVIYQLQTLRR